MLHVYLESQQGKRRLIIPLNMYQTNGIEMKMRADDLRRKFVSKRTSVAQSDKKARFFILCCWATFSRTLFFLSASSFASKLGRIISTIFKLTLVLGNPHSWVPLWSKLFAVITEVFFSTESGCTLGSMIKCDGGITCWNEENGSKIKIEWGVCPDYACFMGIDISDILRGTR